jgi:hypothetical protein
MFLNNIGRALFGQYKERYLRALPTAGPIRTTISVDGCGLLLLYRFGVTVLPIGAVLLSQSVLLEVMG